MKTLKDFEFKGKKVILRSDFNVSIKEGKNREVRKILGSIGLKVSRLIRIAYGPYNLGDLKMGEIVESPILDI